MSGSILLAHLWGRASKAKEMTEEEMAAYQATRQARRMPGYSRRQRMQAAQAFSAAVRATKRLARKKK